MILSDEALFVYDIAFYLRIPVYQLLDEMPYEEFLGWCSYFDSRPPGWQEDNRTFKLLQAQGFKGKPEEVFSSLGKMFKQKDIEHVDGMLKHPKLQGSLLFNKMLSARGGESISND